jgi:hypothetical protein
LNPTYWKKWQRYVEADFGVVYKGSGIDGTRFPYPELLKLPEKAVSFVGHVQSSQSATLEGTAGASRADLSAVMFDSSGFTLAEDF